MTQPPSALPSAAGPRPIDIALLISVFVVAACGLLYELAAGGHDEDADEQGDFDRAGASGWGRFRQAW